MIMYDFWWSNDFIQNDRDFEKYLSISSVKNYDNDTVNTKHITIQQHINHATKVLKVGHHLYTDVSEPQLTMV